MNRPLRIGNDLVVDIDGADRDQRPGQQDGCSRFPAEAESPHDDCCQYRSQRLDDRIALRDSRAAAAAFSTQDQITQDRDILQCCYLRATGRATGSWNDEVEAPNWNFCSLSLSELLALGAPFTLHHDRQPVNYDIQKATNQQ